MCLIRSELGFLGELDDAFLVPLAGIPFAHGPSIPSPLPREVLVFVIRVIVRRAFPPLPTSFLAIAENRSDQFSLHLTTF